MKNKLIFRILGALSSALIIVSVFVPFVKVTGYSQSLWQTNVNTLYLPIIIIVFGGIGVLLFAINLKTELAYSTTGALLFFLITQTIPIINQGTFGTLNVGYYFLVVGTLLTGVMTFLCGIKSKSKVVEETKVEEEKEDSMINQIDRLYENQTVQNNETEINQVEMIKPLETIAPIQPLNQSNNSLNMPIEESEPEAENLNNLLQSTTQTNLQDDQKVENQQIIEDNLEQPTIIEEKTEQVNNVSNPVVSEFETPIQETPVQQSNPVVSEFETPIQEAPVQQSNPVVSEFETPIQETPVQQSNPVVSEFETPIQEAPVQQSNSVVSEFETPIQETPVQQSNPVVSEFETPSQFSFGATPIVQEPIENSQPQTTTVDPLQTLQPLGGNVERVDVMADPAPTNNNSSSNLDIFG